MNSPLLRKTLVVWVGVSGLALGFVVGYLVPKGGDKATGETHSAKDPDSPTATRLPAEKTSNTAVNLADSPSSNVPLTGLQRTETALKVYQSMPPNNLSIALKWLENLPTNEIPLFLEGICAANLSPGGMDLNQKVVVIRALDKWWKVDRQAVLSWVTSLPPGPTKRFLSLELLESIIYESEPDLAIRMAKDFKARDPEWKFDVIQEKMVRKAIEKGWKNPASTAEQMLELYSQSNLPGQTGYMVPNIENYPENFDFRKFLDGLSALMKQNKKPSQIPGDALKTWARIDPQAAAAWLMEATEKKDFNYIPMNDWQSISSAVAHTHGTQAYYEWASEVLSGASDKFITWQFQPSGSDLLGIVGATQNPAARDRFLTYGLRGSDIDSTLRYLGMMSSPEIRLRAISENSYHFKEAFNKFQLDDSVFQELGITREQMNEAIQAD